MRPLKCFYKFENTDPSVEIGLATPLAAYIRVPLTWYQSTTHAFFDDETHAMIRRVYTHPEQEHSKRQFCGYCGTPLSYWSENPPSEADFIHLTLGSLLREDLRDLESMGLIPDSPSDSGSQEETEKPAQTPGLRQSHGIPWFDGMVEGSRVGRMCRRHGLLRRSRDGTIKIDWEIIEYSDSGDEQKSTHDDNVNMKLTHHGKRKLQDRDDVDVDTVEGA